MVERSFWHHKIDVALQQKPIVWLAGVRRSGKTFLCQSFKDVQYYDCELPSVRRKLNAEEFLKAHQNETLVLDEIHRLENPSEILKVAADHYPSIKIIATGSSTLLATEKFQDTLTGRKRIVWLTPMNYLDLEYFKIDDVQRRLRLGGLPPFCAQEPSEKDYQEWIDSYWAKDIQELFRIERRASFLKFIELLFVNSGAIFEASHFSGPCEVSRTTIQNYLSALEATLVAHVIRPFSTRKSAEIIAAPKVYGFDTGFVTFFKGWEKLRTEDCGLLFEHWVLNEFNSVLQSNSLQYWRDKAGHEIDFIWKRRGKDPITIECNWKLSQLSLENLRSFRKRYPRGENLIIAADCAERHFKKVALSPSLTAELTMTGPSDLYKIIREFMPSSGYPSPAV